MLLKHMLKTEMYRMDGILACNTDCVLRKVFLWSTLMHPPAELKQIKEFGLEVGKANGIDPCTVIINLELPHVR